MQVGTEKEVSADDGWFTCWLMGGQSNRLTQVCGQWLIFAFSWRSWNDHFPAPRRVAIIWRFVSRADDFCLVRPVKFNITPQKRPGLQKESPLLTIDFQGGELLVSRKCRRFWVFFVVFLKFHYPKKQIAHLLPNCGSMSTYPKSPFHFSIGWTPRQREVAMLPQYTDNSILKAIFHFFVSEILWKFGIFPTKRRLFFFSPRLYVVC